MTRPWSALEIEVKMREVAERQDDAVAEAKELGEAFAEAKRAYEVKKNQSILDAKGRSDLTTDAQRLAWATVQAADLRRAKDIAESTLHTQRDVIRVLNSQADTLRSLLRSARDLTEEPGFGGRR